MTSAIKNHISFAFILLSFSISYAQFKQGPTKSVPTTNGIALDVSLVQSAIEYSKNNLSQIAGEDVVKNMIPLGIDFEVIAENDSELLELHKQNPSAVPDRQGKMIYVVWGYNRAFHTPSDTTFHTPDGTFTIHDASAQDRPSSGFWTYVDPTKLTQPQYIVKVGLILNKHWSVELGQDHMKWVFDPSKQYEISGQYNRNVWINHQSVSFEEAIQQKDASFILLEHSDGHNYINAQAAYTEPLFTSKNNRIHLDASIGAGLGILVPKTYTRIRDTESGAFRGLDNKFQLAGWGAHTEARLKFSYRFKNGKEVFLLGAGRGVMAKVNDAPFIGSEGSISQSPIYSLQVYAAGGLAVPIFQNKKSGRK